MRIDSDLTFSFEEPPAEGLAGRSISGTVRADGSHIEVAIDHVPAVSVRRTAPRLRTVAAGLSERGLTMSVRGPDGVLFTLGAVRARLTDRLLARSRHVRLQSLRKMLRLARQQPRITTRLQQTVDTLLLLSRTETASADIVREPVLLRSIVDECAALHAQRVRQRQLTLTLQLPDAFTLETDARLLRIIVMNLIANAVEYSPPASEVMIISGSRENPIVVSNPAPMLQPEDLPHLFERLWQKDAARTDSAHAGLGLSLAQGCASALGFHLSAELSPQGMLRMSLRVQN